MTEFWLATFVIDGSGKDTPPPDVLSKKSMVALEVLRDGDNWAVLLSSADDGNEPKALICHLGFTNAPDPCNLWHGKGFPLVDATISFDPVNYRLTVDSPCFHSAPVMEYQTTVLELIGLGLNQGQPIAPVDLTDIPYVQQLQTPDNAQPGTLLKQCSITWKPPRAGTKSIQDNLPTLHLRLGQTAPRVPALYPFVTGKCVISSVWTGTMAEPPEPKLGTTIDRISTATSRFGSPSYRFEDVEVIGFRIDLEAFGSDFSSELARLIAPLNFHLSERTAAAGLRPLPDFKYAVAAPTILIELLRYARMKSLDANPPLTTSDSQSQHELIVRLLVGRVDDDTTQAYAPATYAPMVFLDNPWSKLLGRDMLGYDKRLAAFCVQQGGTLKPLLPDGRLHPSPKDAPVPLINVSQINLRSVDSTSSPPLLELSYPDDPGNLTGINLNATFDSLLGAIRWELSDFSAAQFSQSFARQSIWNSLRTFTCVQTTPLDYEDVFGSTWVSNRFRVDPDIQVGLPVTSANLTLHAVNSNGSSTSPANPVMWNLLCQMLGDGQTAHVRLAPGGWYRLSCSMNLTVDDDLDWNDSTV